MPHSPAAEEMNRTFICTKRNSRPVLSSGLVVLLFLYGIE